MASPQTRLWLGSALLGILFSCLITLSFGIWCPLSWPGWFVATATIIVGHGECWDFRVFLVLGTLVNAALYTWIGHRVLNAEVTVNGRIGTFFAR